MVIVLRANILPGRLRFLKAQACVLFVFIVIRHLLAQVVKCSPLESEVSSSPPGRVVFFFFFFTILNF